MCRLPQPVVGLNFYS